MPKRKPSAASVKDVRATGQVARAESLESRLLLSGQSFPNEQFETGNNPESVATADFNGDGAPDLVTADSDYPLGDNSSVSVLIGNGDGTFRQGVRFRTGRESSAVITADFNADGKADIAIANQSSDTISVVLGIGDGTFRAGSSVNLGGGHPISLVTADFNGDGKLDLVVGGDSSYYPAWVVLGTGTGGFGTPQALTVLYKPQALVAADFNGDGRADFAYANDSSIQQASVLLGNGNGTFAAATFYKVADGSARASGIDTGDFNDDGKADLALACGTTVSVLLNNGDGTFAAFKSFALNSYANPASVRAGDFNGDGRLDLAATGNSGIQMLSGNGDGTFVGGGGLIGVGRQARGLATADFNRDGRADLAVTNPASDTVSVLLGQRNGTFFGKEVMAEAPVNFTGDGRLDLVNANVVAKTINLRLGNGDGTFAAAKVATLSITPAVIAPGDLNGDGRTDLVVASTARSVTGMLGNAGGTFTTGPSYNVYDNPNLITLGDLNGDGRLDMVAAVPRDPTLTLLLPMIGLGNGGFTGRPSFDASWTVRRMTLADANGDGGTDLIVGDSTASRIAVIPGDGDGNFGWTVPIVSAATSTNLNYFTTGDFNADGRIDLAAPNPGTNAVSVMLGVGDGTFAAPVNYATGFRPAAAAGGDFDGDGVLDLATASFESYNVSVLLGNGDGTFRSRRSFGVGTQLGLIAAADFNGEGLDDLLTHALTDSSRTGDLRANAVVLLSTNDVPPRALPATLSPTPTAITLAFSEAVSLDPTALVVTPPAGGAPISPSSVTFDPATKTARFVFATPLLDGDYLATIDAGKVVDSAGQPLPDNFAGDFFVMAGDANRDRTVGFADLLALAKNYGKPGTWSEGDFTGDGTINFADLLVLAKAYNTSLPAVPPSPAAASSDREERPAQALFSTTPVAAPVPVAAKPKPALRPARR